MALEDVELVACSRQRSQGSRERGDPPTGQHERRGLEDLLVEVDDPDAGQRGRPAVGKERTTSALGRLCHGPAALLGGNRATGHREQHEAARTQLQ